MKRKKKGYWYRPLGQYSGAWNRAHPEFCQPVRPPSIVPDAYQVLQVSNEHFKANCFWKRSFGQWICIDAEPPVNWMKGMEKAAAKLEIARMGLDYTWISTASSLQEARAAGSLTAKGASGALQITRHEKITGGPDRTNTGKGVVAGNGSTLTGSMAESVSLQTGSLRESSLHRPGESSSASVSQGLTMEMLVPTAVGPKPQTEEQADIHKSARVKPSQRQLIQSVQAY